MRGKAVRKRKIEADEVYGSVVVSRLINNVMQDGKKSVARKIVYSALEEVGEKTKKKPLEMFEKALSNVKPKLEVRSRRVGGANYQVPMPVADDRQVTLALRWIVDAARSRRKREFYKALAEEILDASNKTGMAMKQKEDTHKMAEANKAFAHFQW